MTSSLKHEYMRPTLTSRCDVISDVINIKSIFSGIISDDSYLMSKWTYLKYFKIFKMSAILRSRRYFKPEVVPWLESYIEIGHATPYILSFCSTFSKKKWQTDRHTDKPFNEHTCQCCKFWQVIKQKSILIPQDAQCCVTISTNYQDWSLAIFGTILYIKMFRV